MVGGRLRFSRPAVALRADPALLRSAYLLRGSDPGVEAPGDSERIHGSIRRLP
jgi:hypothetical protein